MEKLVELIMTKLFQLAENVCNRCSLDKCEPVAVTQQKTIPTIHFTNDMKPKQVRQNVNAVEGDLFI